MHTCNALKPQMTSMPKFNMTLQMSLTACCSGSVRLLKPRAPRLAQKGWESEAAAQWGQRYRPSFRKFQRNNSIGGLRTGSVVRFVLTRELTALCVNRLPRVLRQKLKPHVKMDFEEPPQ